MLHPSLFREPGVVDVETFFDDLFPKALARRASSGPPGRVAFFLSGVGGGAWVVDLQTATVSSAVPSAAVELVCAMSVDNFNALLAGELDAKSAFATGEVTVTGDLALLQAISALFV